MDVIQLIHDLLKRSNLFSHNNVEIISSYKSIHTEIYAASFKLSNALIFDQNLFDIIIKCENPDMLATSFVKLKTASILTSENIKVLKSNDKKHMIVVALDWLEDAKILTQENFNALFLQENAWLLSNDAEHTLFHAVLGIDIDQQRFNKILELTQSEDPNENVGNYVDDIVRENAQINENNFSGISVQIGLFYHLNHVDSDDEFSLNLNKFAAA